MLKIFFFNFLTIMGAQCIDARRRETW